MQKQILKSKNTTELKNNKNNDRQQKSWKQRNTMPNNTKQCITIWKTRNNKIRPKPQKYIKNPNKHFKKNKTLQTINSNKESKKKHNKAMQHNTNH